MLRSLLIYLSKASWAQQLVMRWAFAWRAASRFVAGTTIDEAVRVVRELNDRGLNVTIDHLGEHTSTASEADEATDAIIETLKAVKASDLCANISIKLTQIGLGLDEQLCRRNLERVLSSARDFQNFVRIDMEDTPYTDQTIALYQEMRRNGFGHVGIVLQSYLYRTENDTRQLLEQGSPIRLVKGAYQEPADRAFPRKADVDANFDLLTKQLLDASLSQDSSGNSVARCIPPLPAIATHDEKRIAFALQYATKIGLPATGFEFQMLYGIRRDLQERLKDQGFSVRVYVPFGSHWYPYFVRRLAERPANVWFFLSNLVRN